MVDALDRFVDKRSRVESDGIVKVLRKRLFQIVHFFPDSVSGRQGVGVRELEDGKAAARMAVDLARNVLVTGPHLDATTFGPVLVEPLGRYLLDVDLAAIGRGTDDDVVELLRF